MPILLYALTAALYAVLAAPTWQQPGSDATTARARLAKPLRFAVLVPLALHAALLYHSLFFAPELRFGFGHALSVTLWLAVAIYWVESLFVRVDSLQAFVLPLAGFCVLLPAAFPGFSLREYAHSFEFRVHLVMAMAAYSLFMIAALHAVMMSLLERRLHRGPLPAPFADLPPLLTLERLLFRVIAIGFVLLTLTLGTGILFSEEMFGRPMRFDHKTVFAVASWMIFAALLYGRYRHGWRGRAALRWVFAGFASLLLAYVGSRFVLEVILHRTVV